MQALAALDSFRRRPDCSAYLASLLGCGQLSPDLRQSAGLVLKNELKRAGAAALPPSSRAALLSALGCPLRPIRHAAAASVAAALAGGKAGAGAGAGEAADALPDRAADASLDALSTVTFDGSFSSSSPSASFSGASASAAAPSGPRPPPGLAAWPELPWLLAAGLGPRATDDAAEGALSAAAELAEDAPAALLAHLPLSPALLAAAGGAEALAARGQARAEAGGAGAAYTTAADALVPALLDFCDGGDAAAGALAPAASWCLPGASAGIAGGAPPGALASPPSSSAAAAAAVRSLPRSDALRAVASRALTRLAAAHPPPLLAAVDRYLQSLFSLAHSPDASARRAACEGLVQATVLFSDRLEASLDDLVGYFVVASRDPDPGVAIEACEFWSAFCDSPVDAERLRPRLNEVVALLLDGMVFDEDDEEVLEIEDAEERALHAERADGGARDAAAAEEPLAPSARESAPVAAWTLRRSSAAGLDALASLYGDELLPAVLPVVSARLRHADWRARESAVLALGAVALGCGEALDEHLAGALAELEPATRDPRPALRAVACWCVARLARRIGAVGERREREAAEAAPCAEDPHALARGAAESLARALGDRNPRVREAACGSIASWLEDLGDAPGSFAPELVSALGGALGAYPPREARACCDALAAAAEHAPAALADRAGAAAALAPLVARLADAAPRGDPLAAALLEALAPCLAAAGRAAEPVAPDAAALCLETAVRAARALCAAEAAEDAERVLDEALERADPSVPAPPAASRAAAVAAAADRAGAAAEAVLASLVPGGADAVPGLARREGANGAANGAQAANGSARAAAAVSRSSGSSSSPSASPLLLAGARASSALPHLSLDVADAATLLSCALDALGGLAEGLGPSFDALLERLPGGRALPALVLLAGTRRSPDARQSAFALAGDAARSAPSSLAPVASHLLVAASVGVGGAPGACEELAGAARAFAGTVGVPGGLEALEALGASPARALAAALGPGGAVLTGELGLAVPAVTDVAGLAAALRALPARPPPPQAEHAAANNAAWALGELALATPRDALRPAAARAILALAAPLLAPPGAAPRSLLENAAVALGRLAKAGADAEVAAAVAAAPDALLPRWCGALRSLRDDVEKRDAFQGLCEVAARDADAAVAALVPLCAAVASWRTLADPAPRDALAATMQGIQRRLAGAGHWDAAVAALSPQPMGKLLQVGLFS